MYQQIPSNPFANYGSIVCGEEFVGRQKEIRKLQQRVLTSACTSITGSPRIGKSSLAHQALIYPKESLLEKKFIALWLYLPDFKDHHELFRGLVSEALIALEEAGVRETEAAFIRVGQDLLNKNLSWLDLQNGVRRFFQRLKQAKWATIAIIDEFDHARNIFQDGNGFEALRQLNYEPRWRISIVTISRRSLLEITSYGQIKDSIFPGIFEEVCIQGFNQSELLELVNKLREISFYLEKSSVDFLWTKAGGHPFLSCALLRHITSSHLDGQELSLEQVFQDAASEFFVYYKHLVNILSETDALDKLLQILFGPVTTATINDAMYFKRYGLIKTIPNENNHAAFSLHFENYLQTVEREKEYWPLWRETERGLRILITRKMKEKYKANDWVSKLEKEISDSNRLAILSGVFDSCRSKQQCEQDNLGDQASKNLLDFADPGDLFKIMKVDWDLFRPILHREPTAWEEAFSILSKVRIPMSQHRDQSVEIYDRQKAEGYCREICSLLREQISLQ